MPHGAKESKAEARYRNYPLGTQRCSGCTMFRPPDNCTKVIKGKDGIASCGWCRNYYAKGEKDG